MSTRLRRFLLALLLCHGNFAAGQTDIHRCTQADGTVAFQEMPCQLPSHYSESERDRREQQVEADDSDTGDKAFDFSSPYDEIVDQPSDSETNRQELLTGDSADCEKATRDAIDAIDLKIRQSSTGRYRQRYLDELLELTARLRKCKEQRHPK